MYYLEARPLLVMVPDLEGERSGLLQQRHRPWHDYQESLNTLRYHPPLLVRHGDGLVGVYSS